MKKCSMCKWDFNPDPQCRNYRNLLSPKKYFVKSTMYLVISLVKELLARNFCQKRVRVNFRNFHTVRLWSKQKKITFFRQINIFNKEELIWRKIFWRNCAQCTMCTVWKFREISLTNRFFRETVFQKKSKTLFFTYD